MTMMDTFTSRGGPSSIELFHRANMMFIQQQEEGADEPNISTDLKKEEAIPRKDLDSGASCS